MTEIAIILHNVRSAHNVGAIMRTAECAGVARAYLSGYTPRPVDRFGRSDAAIAKTALGAERTLQWSHTMRPTQLFGELRRGGWRIVGVEQDARAHDYRALSRQGKVVFVFGNEVRGLSVSLRAACDELIEIPMHGTKESLNVGVAAGIVLFQYV